MSSFCLGEIYEKNQSGAERLLLFYLKLRRRNCQKGKRNGNNHFSLHQCSGYINCMCDQQ